VLRLVVQANARWEKAPVLLELREGVKELKVLCRLGHDVEALDASSPPPVAARQTVNDEAP
jgi:hypothetical protein